MKMPRKPLLLTALALVACSAPPTPVDVAPEESTTEESTIEAPWLRGRVVDASGAPVPHVPVMIHGGIATRWKIGETETDDLGRFLFQERVEGASYLIDEPRADYVGVCAGKSVGGLNPPAYLPWVDVRIAPGETGECTLVLDPAEVERKLAELRAQ